MDRLLQFCRVLILCSSFKEREIALSSNIISINFVIIYIYPPHFIFSSLSYIFNIYYYFLSLSLSLVSIFIFRSNIFSSLFLIIFFFYLKFRREKKYYFEGKFEKQITKQKEKKITIFEKKAYFRIEKK